MFNFLRLTGSAAISFMDVVGRFIFFFSRAISGVVRGYFCPRIMWQQFLFNFFYSLPVVAMTAIFSGAVLALQSYTGFSRFSAENSIANIVVLSITRELGPVLAGLMVAGRVGAANAAELGSMRVSEQLDAMKIFQADPAGYLVMPRIFAGFIALPLLVLIADIIGVMGGYLVSVYYLGFNSYQYIISSFNFLEAMDVISGLVKAACFGVIIASISCYNGFYSSGGARGVGLSTTSAVVYSSIMILLSNYFITALFFSK